MIPAPRMPATVFVYCCVCGKRHPAASKDVQYRSLDRQWWCTDETECTEHKTRNAIQMQAALNQVWRVLEDNEWKIP